MLSLIVSSRIFPPLSVLNIEKGIVGLAEVTGNTSLPKAFGQFLNKKYFGVLVHVPLGTEKTVVFRYTLPKDIERTWYDLKVEKQPGLNDVPVKVTVIKADGTKEEKEFVLNRNTVLSDVE